MIYKLISCNEIIAKIFTDLDLKEGDHRISDIVSWIGEALEKIGSFPQFTTKVTGKEDLPLLEISNYQTRLPFDLHRVVQIAYSPTSAGPYYPMRRATGSFDYAVPSTDTTSVDNIASTSNIVTLAMSLYDLTYAQALAKINNEPATKSLLNGLLSDNTTVQPPNANATESYDYTYIITSNYVKTNVETGYLMVSYQAIPTDADGYPLIPDLPSFKEALYWYVNMKLMYPEWKAGQVRDAVYYDARRSWNYFCKQAYGDALTPDRDEMESIKNTWMKLIPEINAHSNFYNTMGQQEVIYNSHKV